MELTSELMTVFGLMSLRLSRAEVDKMTAKNREHVFSSFYGWMPRMLSTISAAGIFPELWEHPLMFQGSQIARTAMAALLESLKTMRSHMIGGAMREDGDERTSSEGGCEFAQLIIGRPCFISWLLFDPQSTCVQSDVQRITAMNSNEQQCTANPSNEQQ